MPGPFSVNTGLILPLTGSLVDLWGEDAVNPDFVAIDGLLCGVQTISVSSAPVTLTSPAGFVPTPSPGPTQSQNRVLRFTGILTANVRVTLPIPGVYVIENATTSINFVLSFQGVVATEVVAVPPNMRCEVYNDGANVRFVNLGFPGEMKLLANLNTVIPGWVGACTVKPYLLCDGTVYNFSDFPILGGVLGGTFGGNGITTFGVPDLRGRFPLAYDGTGTRITTAGCGLNGQTLGAVSGATAQSSQLVTANLPAYTPTGAVATTSTPIVSGSPAWGGTTVANAQSGAGVQPPIVGSPLTVSSVSTFTGNAQGGSSTIFSNVPPTQVVGVWVIKT